ncbi:hypothetical protein BH18ACT7_BH18ACT7_16890 [soil metagenome]
MAYRVPLTELLDSVRVDPEEIVELRDEPSTNGLPQEWSEEAVWIAAIAVA